MTKFFKIFRKGFIDFRRNREIIKICKSIRSFALQNRCTYNKTIPGLTTSVWILPDNEKIYKVINDHMIRGSLFSVVELDLTGKTIKLLCEFGDQSQQYSGFLGLCDDILCDDELTLDKVKNILKLDIKQEND